MAEVGDRVGAILSADAGRIEFLGYGVYEGMIVPELPMGVQQVYGNPFAQAKITLDNGDVVWGGECRWDSQKAVRKQLKEAKEVVTVSIHDHRWG